MVVQAKNEAKPFRLAIVNDTWDPKLHEHTLAVTFSEPLHGKQTLCGFRQSEREIAVQIGMQRAIAAGFMSGIKLTE